MRSFKSRFIEMFSRYLEKDTEFVHLDNICTTITDGSHFSPKENPEGTYPMLSVKDMSEKGFDYDHCKMIDEEVYKQLIKNGCGPESGDILIAKDGATAFQKGFVLNDSRPQVVLSSIAILRPKTNVINPIFLLHYLFDDSVRQNIFRNKITGSAITRIVLKDLKSINVAIPPIELQNQFADFVRQVDKSKFILEIMLNYTRCRLNNTLDPYNSASF